jgi:hypothetical protein
MRLPTDTEELPVGGLQRDEVGVVGRETQLKLHRLRKGVEMSTRTNWLGTLLWYKSYEDANVLHR